MVERHFKRVVAFFLSLLSVCAVVPDYSKVGLNGVLSWATTRNENAVQKFRSTRTYWTSPKAWDGKVVYQIQVDRFNNGNVTNDNLNIPPEQQQNENTSNLYGLPSYRHGGDLAGITQRLPYLVDLGIEVLWITPILHHDGSYHGYCTVSHLHVDPGFGTDDELVQLVQKAHAAGILVVLDIVVNHLCDSATHYDENPSHEQCAQDLWTMYWGGSTGSSQHQGSLSFSPRWFPPLHGQSLFSRCGANSGADTSGEDPAAVFGDFTANMIDFDTRNTDFQKIFTELHKYWIAFADVDGFRLDAAKHVTADFIAYFSTNIRDFAKKLGKENFYVVGEVAASAQWEARRLGQMESNPGDPSQHGNVPKLLTNMMWQLRSTYLAHPVSKFAGLNGVYDFAASGISRDVTLNHKPANAIADYFSSDTFKTIDGQGDYHLSWTLVEIHDWPRFLSDNPTQWQKSVVAAAYMLTAPGMPIIYYGFEQGFNMDCHWDNMNAGSANDNIKQLCSGKTDDSLKRQDMFVNSPWRLGSAITQINSLAYIGKWKSAPPEPWQSDPFLGRTHELYTNVRKLVHLRRSCQALTRGGIFFRYVESRMNGLVIFSRIGGGQEIVVVLNTDNSNSRQIPSPITVDANINRQAGAVYVNVLSDHKNKAYIGVSNGASSLYVNNPKMSVFPNGYVIFVSQANSKPFDSRLGVSLCVS